MPAKSIEEIAREAHDRHQKELNEKMNSTVSEETASETTEIPSENPGPSSESPMVFTDDDLTEDDAENIVKNAEKSDVTTSTSVKMLTRDDIANFMPDMDAGIRSKKADAIFQNMMEYKKKLMIEEGFTPDEANRAIMARSKKDATYENNKWLDDHPHTGVITIEKGKEDQLALTDDEHKKLVTTNVIELHLVTSKDLKHTKLASVPSSGSKLDYVRTLNSMAVRSVAMPALGDSAIFRSATSAEIIRSGISVEAKSPLESIDKLSSFLYDHFVSCHTFSKYDDKNAVVLSYQEFCDKFPFFEVPMAEYAIYAASSPESITVDLSCNKCHNPFKWDMHPDKMLAVNQFNEREKKEYDSINAHFNNVEWLENNSNEKMKPTIMESPTSKNRFVIQNPTISRAKQIMQAAENLNLYDVEDGSDEAELNATIIACAMMLNSLYIYSKKDDAYIEFGPDDVEDILRVLASIPNDDFRMINKFTLNYYYAPTFSSGMIKCPKCHSDIVFEPTADQLLFLYAREEFKIQ